MAVRIVLDGPSRGVGLRLGRVLAVIVSLPLMVAGVAGLYGVILIGIFFAYTSPVPAKDQHDAITRAPPSSSASTGSGCCAADDGSCCSCAGSASMTRRER